MRNKQAYPVLGILIFIAFLFVGCQEEVVPTPDYVLPSPTNTIVPPTSTQPPTRIPTFTPEFTATSEAPTATLEPTATSQPTPTPIPQLIIEVINSEEDEPAGGVTVHLSQPARGYDANFLTLSDGLAYFVNLIPSNAPYIVEINQPGFLPISMEVTVIGGSNTFTFELERGANVIINTETVNLREEAGLEYDVVVEAKLGDSFAVIGVSDDLDWIQVVTPEGAEGWVLADLVDIEGDLRIFGVPVTPVAQTPVPGQTATPAATVEPGTELTPTPYVPPVRPPRVQFNPRALYQDMIDLQDVTVQLRGVMDRRTGNTLECNEFIIYYQEIMRLQTYRNVPEDWTKIHNLYVNSATNTLDTSRAIYLQCLEGGGPMSAFNFRNARNGIDFSLERLRLGIIGAEDRIGVPPPVEDETPTPTSES